MNYSPYTALLPALSLLAACSSGPSKEERQQAQADNPARTITTPKAEKVHLPAGKPAGQPEPFLTGFQVGDGSDKAYGRPVGVVTLPDGALLVADDAGNKLWRVSASKSAAAAPAKAASVASR